ncbi:MAG: AtpZ/AtpI family protein [Chloroflexi bacterium]|nr:AtpZ/AtpI family protein [Chloroflexota bacterium]
MSSTPEPPKTTGESGSSQEHAEGGWSATLALLGKVGGIGWFVGVTIALGTLGGYWLDGQFDTAPVLTISGLALGVATAFVGMIRLLGAIRRGR